jgi:glutamine phosphoribosylpyrophosphate amidotransferase
MIRGKHATGVTYFREGKLYTIKEPVSADVFIKQNNIKDWIDDNGNLCFIGHTRYSTSDLHYNQPMESDHLSIAHNGVISQEPPETWKAIFGYDTKTRNDSELVLRCIENGENPLYKFPDSSMAVAKIDDIGTVTVFRNGERPLYVAYLQEYGYAAASTKDILIRSGVGASCVKRLNMNEMVTFEPIQKGLVFSRYTFPNKYKKDLQC